MIYKYKKDAGRIILYSNRTHSRSVENVAVLNSYGTAFVLVKYRRFQTVLYGIKIFFLHSFRYQKSKQIELLILNIYVRHRLWN